MSEVLEIALEATAHGSCLSGSDLLLLFFAKKRHCKCSKSGDKEMKK
ncbi:MAG: hypothetical protein LE178_04485 [Endomicrobium sp.]|nr:hypothetical protein [Endomicrobium sp.]